MLSLPPSMAGVPAETQPTAPRMSGAKGVATPAEGAAQTGFEAELMAAGQTAQVSETPARRSDNGRPAVQPGETGRRTGEASSSQAAPQDADTDLDLDAIALETGGGVQTPSQTTAPITAPQGDGQTTQQAPIAANDAGEQGVAAPGEKSGAPAKPAPDQIQAPDQTQAPDQIKGPAPAVNAGPNTDAVVTPGAEAKSPDAKSGEAKSGDAKAAAGAQPGAASARPSGELVDPSRSDARPAAQEASQPSTQGGAQGSTETAAGKTPRPTGDADTATTPAPTPAPDLRKQAAKATAEPSAQGLSGLKSDAKAGPGAGEARPDLRADAPAAQRAAFGQSRNDGARREGGDQPSRPAAEVRPAASAPASAGPVPAASRPLAELIAMQLQPLPQGALLAPDGQAAGLDPLLSGDADAVMDPVQMRAEIRADALRTPGQAGQAARFTPHTVQHLAARVAQTAADGGRTFDIRLDPAELGRVRVRLEMGADNSVRAVLSAERADTLAELQRTSRDLVKALEDAGLDLAENGLEFSLSQGGQDEQGGFGGYTPVFVDTEIMTGEAAASSAPPGPATLYGFALHARARLDVRI